MRNKVGLGSFFHSIAAEEIVDFSTKNPISNYSLFYTGRHAIKFIFDQLSAAQKIEKIWLPNYYCQHVTSWLQNCYTNIHFYPIDPFSADHSLAVLDFATANDIVLLNNFWGIFNYTIPKTGDRPICIEDHSHGWLSSGCLESSADYCVASLRKTLPVPLGGILWQPNKKQHKTIPINTLSNTNFYENWECIQAAMNLKQAYIIGTEEATAKDNYLAAIATSENYLQHQYEVVPLQPAHHELITSFLPKDYTVYKKQNFKILFKNINPNASFKLITDLTNTPFGLHLVFKDRKAFASLKAHLIENNIYPSELWPGNEPTKSWSYLLNVHIDFRYAATEMKYIAAVINDWTNG